MLGRRSSRALGGGAELPLSPLSRLVGNLAAEGGEYNRDAYALARVDRVGEDDNRQDDREELAHLGGAGAVRTGWEEGSAG